MFGTDECHDAQLEFQDATADATGGRTEAGQGQGGALTGLTTEGMLRLMPPAMTSRRGQGAHAQLMLHAMGEREEIDAHRRVGCRRREAPRRMLKSFSRRGRSHDRDEDTKEGRHCQTKRKLEC